MNKLKILPLVALLFSLGCGMDVDYSAVVDPLPDTDKALVIIQARYEITTLPQIYWYGGKKLTCSNGHGWIADNGDCVLGTYSAGVALVSDFGRTFPISSTGLMHEVYHYALDVRGLDIDPSHAGPGWQPGGEVWLATQDLVRVGY